MRIIQSFFIFGLVTPVLLTPLISEGLNVVFITFMHNYKFKNAVLYEDII